MNAIMERKPLVSVIINAYNYGRFIDEAIESVLTQDFPRQDREVIVVDDGSTDNTAERIKRYHNEIRYFYKKNGGQASALNIGIGHSRGELIAFLDADDYWDRQKLAVVAERFGRSQSIDFVYHNIYIDNQNGHIEPLDGSDIVNDAAPGDIDRKAYFEGNIPFFCPPTSGIAVRSRCLNHIFPIPEHYRLCVDVYLHFFLLFHARQFYFLKKPLAYYRLHGDNLFQDSADLQRMTENKIRQSITTHRYLIEDIERYGRLSGNDVTGLRALITSWVYRWQREKTLSFRLRQIAQTHKDILRKEGVSRYFLYAYRYRKNQLARVIKGFF